MGKLNARERLALAVTLGVLGLFVGDRLVWSPLSQSWQQLDEAISHKQRQLVRDQHLLEESVQIKKEYAAISERNGGEAARGGGMTRILLEIEAQARSSGVKISDVKPQRAQGRAAGPSVVLVVQSGWEPMARFIYQIQRSPQLLQIEKATVRRNGDDATLMTGQFVIAGIKGDDAS